MRLFSYAMLVCLVGMCGCCEDSCCPTDCTADPCDPVCRLSTSSLSFGSVPVGDSSDLTYVIENICGSTLSGTVSETCDEFSIIGPVSFDLGRGDSVTFTVRFSPTSDGNKTCTVETGVSKCADIQCSGTGVLPAEVVFSDDFEDGNMEDWSDQHVCNDIDSYDFFVSFNSGQDGSMVLTHEGGYASGGGNGEAYVAEGVNLDDVSIKADIWNVAAYHTTAKAVGLTVCLNQTTGVQYLAWYTVAGDLFLYETTGWLSCGPVALAHVVIDPIAVGPKTEMELIAREGMISVWVNGSEVLSYDDSGSPLGAGTAGVVATAGVTLFDNILITTGSAKAQLSAYDANRSMQ